MKTQILITWVCFIGYLVGVIWFRCWWAPAPILAFMACGLTYGYYSGFFCKIGMHDFRMWKGLKDGLPLVSYVKCTRCEETRMLHEE